MNAQEVWELRLKKAIKKVEKEIDEYILGKGWKEVLVSIPSDLYSLIGQHFSEKGFYMRTESYYYRDMDGFETSDVGFNYYIGI